MYSWINKLLLNAIKRALWWKCETGKRIFLARHNKARILLFKYEFRISVMLQKWRNYACWNMKWNRILGRWTSAGGFTRLRDFVVYSNEEFIIPSILSRLSWISCRLREVLTRICARNARGAYYFCAHARKLVPDSVDSSMSSCWNLEEVVRSSVVGAAEKSSASTPNASEKHMKRWRLRVSSKHVS